MFSFRPICLAAFLGAILGPLTGVAAQTLPSNLPAAIVCAAPNAQGWRVGYLGRVNKNGDALYVAPGGGLSATVNAKGVVVAPTDRPAGLDCFGKTLDELRASGRLMDFQPRK
jgi:hypothetical protein